MPSAGSQHSEPEDNLPERNLADGTSNLSHSTSYDSRSSSSSPGADADRIQTRADCKVAPSFDAPEFDSAGVRSASATYVSSSSSSCLMTSASISSASVSVAAVKSGSAASTSALAALESYFAGQQWLPLNAANEATVSSGEASKSTNSHPNLSESVIGLMEDWYEKHEDNPYTTEQDIEYGYFMTKGINAY